MCHCNPNIRTISCGVNCMPKTATQVSHGQEQLRHMARVRSHDIMRHFGTKLTFDELIAEIYSEGYRDSHKAYYHLSANDTN